MLYCGNELCYNEIKHTDNNFKKLILKQIRYFLLEIKKSDAQGNFQ